LNIKNRSSLKFGGASGAMGMPGAPDFMAVFVEFQVGDA